MASSITAAHFIENAKAICKMIPPSPSDLNLWSLWKPLAQSAKNNLTGILTAVGSTPDDVANARLYLGKLEDGLNTCNKVKVTVSQASSSEHSAPIAASMDLPVDKGSPSNVQSTLSVSGPSTLNNRQGDGTLDIDTSAVKSDVQIFEPACDACRKIHMTKCTRATTRWRRCQRCVSLNLKCSFQELKKERKDAASVPSPQPACSSSGRGKRKRDDLSPSHSPSDSPRSPSQNHLRNVLMEVLGQLDSTAVLLRKALSEEE